MRFIAILAGVALIVAAAAMSALLLPPWMTNQFYDPEKVGVATRSTYESAARQSLLFFYGGLLAAAGLFYTHRRHRIDQAANETEREKVDLDRDANRTDRFTKAIEQLGSGSIEVRLGGIYALERISTDSSRDQGVVLEVLTAFIRGHLRSPDPLIPPWRAPLDVEAAMKVVGRRSDEQTSVHPADLSALSGDGVEIRDLRLVNGRLNGSRLIESVLRNAVLTGCDLTGIDLTRANLRQADLRGTVLTSATLSGANLREADLAGANIDLATFDGANARGADLSGVRNWTIAQLGSIRFHDASTRWPKGFTHPRPS